LTLSAAGGGIEFKLKEYLAFYEKTKALKSIKNKSLEWREYKIGELFEKIELKKLNPLDTREFRVTNPDEEHTIPAVVAKVGNNGVMYYVNKNDFETTSNKIVVIGDGAVASGLVYYHEKEFTILHNAYAIKLKNTNETRQIGLYLAAVIQKSIFDFFGYENKPTWNKVKENSISLPIYRLNQVNTDSTFSNPSDSKPCLCSTNSTPCQSESPKQPQNTTSDKDYQIAFDFMESFIKAIEKESIKDVVLWGKKKIKAYRACVDSKRTN